MVGVGDGVNVIVGKGDGETDSMKVGVGGAVWGNEDGGG